MAITATATILTVAADLPSGYTPPSLPDIGGTVETSLYTTDVAISEANADPAVGVANVLAALETHFEGTQAINVLKLNAAATINANLTVRKVERVNDSNIFSPGTEVFRCTVMAEYA